MCRRQQAQPDEVHVGQAGASAACRRSCSQRACRPHGRAMAWHRASISQASTHQQARREEQEVGLKPPRQPFRSPPVAQCRAEGAPDLSRHRQPPWAWRTATGRDRARWEPIASDGKGSLRPLKTKQDAPSPTATGTGNCALSAARESCCCRADRGANAALRPPRERLSLLTPLMYLLGVEIISDQLVRTLYRTLPQSAGLSSAKRARASSRMAQRKCMLRASSIDCACGASFTETLAEDEASVNSWAASISASVCDTTVARARRARATRAGSTPLSLAATRSATLGWSSSAARRAVSTRAKPSVECEGAPSCKKTRPADSMSPNSPSSLDLRPSSSSSSSSRAFKSTFSAVAANSFISCAAADSMAAVRPAERAASGSVSPGSGAVLAIGRPPRLGEALAALELGRNRMPPERESKAKCGTYAALDLTAQQKSERTNFNIAPMCAQNAALC